MALTKISGSILKDPLNLGEVSIGGTLTYQDVTNVDSVGIITARSTIDAQGDISIADKIIHTGDTNTAIRFPAADTITAETGGTERLRINSDGKVGLGTTGSDYALSIREADNNNKFLMLQKNSGQEILQIREDGNNHAIIDGSHASGELHFYTAGVEKARITGAGTTAGGLFLVGTTDTGYSGFYTTMTVGDASGANSGITIAASPTGYSRVHFADANSGAARYAGWIAYSHADDALLFSTNNSGSEKVRIDSSGALIIGDTTSTSQNDRLLQIGKTNRSATYLELRTSTSGVGGIVLSDGTGGGDEGYRGTLEYVHSSDYMIFKTAATERLRIGSDGTLTSTANNNGQIIHSFRNDNTTAGSSAMTVEHWFRFNRTGGGMNASAARIIAGKEREWIGGASNQDGYFAVHTTADETSSEKMRISSGGIMTRPFQPAFSAQGLSSPVDSSEGYTGILSNYMTVMECNVGSHYKTSGSDIGNFVAPVAGNYFFSAGCLIRLRNSSSAGSAELTFHKNGSNITNRSLGYSYVVGSNDHDNLTITAIIPLAAGDKVALVASACSSVCDWYWGEGLGNFNGYLIG